MRQSDNGLSSFLSACVSSSHTLISPKPLRPDGLFNCVQMLSSPQVLANMEDIKVREIQIFDYRKKIAESETKLKQQQNLYEAVRSDRNLYSKNLVEAQVSRSLARLCTRAFLV